MTMRIQNQKKNKTKGQTDEDFSGQGHLAEDPVPGDGTIRIADQKMKGKTGGRVYSEHETFRPSPFPYTPPIRPVKRRKKGFFGNMFVLPLFILGVITLGVFYKYYFDDKTPSAENRDSQRQEIRPPEPEKPTNKPPVTEPPVTEPPVTEPPVTKPPMTRPPERPSEKNQQKTSNLDKAKDKARDGVEIVGGVVKEMGSNLKEKLKNRKNKNEKE